MNTQRRRAHRRARPGWLTRLWRRLMRVAQGGVIALSALGVYAPPPPPPPPPMVKDEDADGDPEAP